MPYEIDVQEKHSYWCPKWYWPFAVCTRTSMVHKYCYNFSWVKATAYMLAVRYEACENGRLYTWWEFGFGLGDQGTVVPLGPACYDSRRSEAGRCDGSNTGLAAQALSPSAPYAGPLRTTDADVGVEAVERGEYDFGETEGGLCRRGVWPWQRQQHARRLDIALDTRFAAIDWFVEGRQLAAPKGDVSCIVLCGWDFPLPKGRHRLHRVSLAYEIVTEANRSTLRLENAPADGNYSLAITAVARDQGTLVKSQTVQLDIWGETCRFDEEQLQAMYRCLLQQRDMLERLARRRKPRPGEPVMVIDPSIVERGRPEDGIARDVIAVLLEAAELSFRVDSATHAEVLEIFAETVGEGRLSAVMSFQPAPPADTVAGPSPQGSTLASLSLRGDKHGCNCGGH